jgi:integrase/recombinase XerD
MTQLRQKMLEELERPDYSHRTAKTYIRIVRDFAAYFHRSPDKLGPEHIRQYQAYLFQSKKLSTASVSQYVSALRFLYVKTLRRHFLTEHIPFPKSPRWLPVVLSPEEVTRLIDAARNLYHRTLLMTLYSTAVRRSELCRLQVSDIDSQRMPAWLCPEVPWAGVCGGYSKAVRCRMFRVRGWHLFASLVRSRAPQLPLARWTTRSPTLPQITL